MLNRKCALSLGIFAFTLILGYASLYLMGLFSVSKWVGVGIASGIFVVMLVIMLVVMLAFRKKRLIPFIVIPVNALANGIAASSLFVYLKVFPPLWQTACLFGALLLIFFIYCLLTNIPFFRRHYIVCMIIYALLVLGGGITALALTKLSIFVLALLSLIPFIAHFIMLASKAENDLELIRHDAYASFAVLAIIIIVVLIVITGEGLDGIDGDLSGAGGSGVDGKKYNPYDYYAF